MVLDEQDTLVCLSDVTKTFANGIVALDDMALTIKAGAFVSLLGPSGCGKTTVLRLIAGLSLPTRGQVLWPNTPVDARGRPDIDIGFVFQEATLMQWARVFANVALPLRLKRVPERNLRRRVEEALEMVGLSDFASHYPRELSGGMKMRVAIARALVTRPPLLLLDEPFAALDEMTRFRLNDDLLDLWARLNWTVIFVTHSIFESAYLSERIAIMRARPGRVVHTLTVDNKAPRNADYRTSPAYLETCRKASAVMHEAMQGQDNNSISPVGAL